MLYHAIDHSRQHFTQRLANKSLSRLIVGRAIWDDLPIQYQVEWTDLSLPIELLAVPTMLDLITETLSRGIKLEGAPQALAAHCGTDPYEDRKDEWLPLPMGRGMLGTLRAFLFAVAVTLPACFPHPARGAAAEDYQTVRLPASQMSDSLKVSLSESLPPDPGAVAWLRDAVAYAFAQIGAVTSEMTPATFAFTLMTVVAFILFTGALVSGWIERRGLRNHRRRSPWDSEGNESPFLTRGKGERECFEVDA